MARESIQNKLGRKRMRSRRVHIQYEIELAGAIEMVELPFVVGILADLSGQPDQPLPPLRERRFVAIDRDNFDSVMSSIAPRLVLELENTLTNDNAMMTVELRFRSLKDFEPEQVVTQVETLRKLLEIREGTLKEELRTSKDLETTFSSRIAEADALLSRQLNLILHAPKFQKLEAAWRGLHFLVSRSETSVELRILVLNVSKEELCRDLEQATDLDWSAFFHKVYADPYGTFACDPFAVFIGDYEFGPTSRDVLLLEQISHVAAAAHAPFLAAAAPQFFSMDSFTTLDQPRDLAKIFEGEKGESPMWKAFRDLEDSRYVGLTLPRILLRLPYGPDSEPVETFHFTEDVDGTNLNTYLWGNAAYALGARLTDAFARYGWCAAIWGPEGGGLVEGLPLHVTRTDERDSLLRGPTEIGISDVREFELADLGFIPLVHRQGTNDAVFFSMPSCQRPKTYDSDDTNTTERLAIQLPYVFAVSRFTHYLKAICRETVVRCLTQQGCENYLNTWINSYVLLDDAAGQELKAEKPLREAEVRVSEVPGKPGVYRAVASLKPHFQLEKPPLALQVVMDLYAGGTPIRS